MKASKLVDASKFLQCKDDTQHSHLTLLSILRHMISTYSSIHYILLILHYSFTLLQLNCNSQAHGKQLMQIDNHCVEHYPQEWTYYFASIAQ